MNSLRKTRGSLTCKPVAALAERQLTLKKKPKTALRTTLEAFSSSGFELQAGSTTVRDIPCECLEMILENLSLVDGYNGWISLKGPNARESRFDTPTWFMTRFQTSCYFSEHEEVDSSTDAGGITNHARSLRRVSPHSWRHSCSLLFYDPVRGKYERVARNLKEGGEVPRSWPESYANGLFTSYSGWGDWVVADKGLLLFNAFDASTLRKFGSKLVVTNVINRSTSVLPPVHFPVRQHEANCDRRTVPLKLVVETGQKGGLKTSASSSFKAYVMQWTTQQCGRSTNFRVMVYDSMTKLWTRTGAEWIGTSPYARIFLTSNAIFVSTGRITFNSPGVKHRDSCHDVMLKFENGRLVGKIAPPYKLQTADQYCSNYCEQHADLGYGFISHSCGCIYSTVFEAEGKIFFFKQTSWIGPYGPNCISAQIWELDCRKKMWRKLPAGPMHLLQTCPGRCWHSFANITFTYNGILIVVRPGWFKNSEFFTDFDYIAGWDIAKKTWCKLPETIVNNLPCHQSFGSFHYRNVADVDNCVFQPSVDTRVGL